MKELCNDDVTRHTKATMSVIPWIAMVMLKIFLITVFLIKDKFKMSAPTFFLKDEHVCIGNFSASLMGNPLWMPPTHSIQVFFENVFLCLFYIRFLLKREN